MAATTALVGVVAFAGCNHQNRQGASSALNPATATATASNAAVPAHPASTAGAPACCAPTAAAANASVGIIQPGTPIFTRDNPLKGADLQNVEHVLGATPGCKAIAVVVLSTECPIANKYIPELNRIAADAKKNHVEFYGLMAAQPPAGATRADALKHSADYKVAFPVLYDTSGELFDRLTPTHTPNALVLSADGVLRYRGRIDDRFVAIGRERDTVTQQDFQDAITAVAASTPIAGTRATTECVGCVVEGCSSVTAGANAPTAVTAAVTYNREIAPIIQNNCAACHHAGEVAPFPLTNFAETVKHAQQVADVTATRIMPPWKPAQGFGHFQGERRLSQREIDLIAAWVKAGTPEGNPADLPPAPVFATGWRLGPPDLVLKMPAAYTLPAEGRDMYRCFVIPTGVTEDKYIAAVDFRPGNPRVVHHTILFLDKTGAAQKKDAADPGPGYKSFGGPGFLPSGSLGGWAPGATPQFLPQGMAKLLPKGSDLAMQMHYNLSGKTETDQSEVGIYFAKERPDHIITGLTLINRAIDIPAGEKRHRETVHFVLPVDVTTIGAFPHMHLLGKEMKVTATLPDGKSVPLIWIKDWDFNWQDQYLFDAPIRLPKGTQLDVEAFYDNSADNERNPHTPPQRVTWGEQTADEMLFCPLLITTDSDADLKTLRRELLKQLLVDSALARMF